MTVLVGYTAERGGTSSLELGALIASARGEDLVVCTVVPESWRSPSLAKVDAEYAGWLAAHANETLADAREFLAAGPAGVHAEFVTAASRSIPRGLLAQAQARSASAIVVGAAAYGFYGHVVLGTVATRLLHSSPVPLALAPRGYSPPAGTRTGRLTCAYDGTEDGIEVVRAAAAWSATADVPLRLVTFGVRRPTMYPPETGLHAEDVVLTEWEQRVRLAQRAAVEAGADIAPSVDAQVIRARDWASALDAVDWTDGDLLFVGSSPGGVVGGMVSRVFLGSHGTKIIRNSPVPAIVLPG